jgi:hypothetical protein
MASARDGDTLLLTTREVRGIGIGLIGQSDLGQQGPGEVLGLHGRHLLHEQRACPHVFECRHVRKQIEQLEDHTGARSKGSKLAVARQFGASAVDHLVAHAYPAALRLLEQVDAAQQCRFA